MSDETKKQSTADKLAPLVNQLEAALAGINAPFHVHQAQKQILAGFWQQVQKLDNPPPPVVPLSTGKKSR